MTAENRTYITHLKVTDVPWHRLTTAYCRGTEFPAHLAVLEQMRDLASVKKSLYELTTNMEHQSTLWHATPFGMVFLSRILEKALAESGQNPAAHFLAGELLDFFACILQCFHGGDEMEHAEALPLFSDLLKEEYLWSEEYDEEEDEMRYEEGVLLYESRMNRRRAISGCQTISMIRRSNSAGGHLAAFRSRLR